MSILGSPNDWINLLDHILPDLLQSVVDSWDKLKRPLKDGREDTVTEALCRALRQHRKFRDLPVYVMPQFVELEPSEGEDLGRIDITFLPTGIAGAPDESIYFCLECKWLNVVNSGKIRRKGSEYVKHGMLRFVTGQYAKAVKYGGMVGYVLDGDIARAIENVEANVQGHCATLHMDAPGILHPSLIMRHISTARESFHRRTSDEIPFCIYHLFMNADNLLKQKEK